MLGLNSEYATADMIAFERSTAARRRSETEMVTISSCRDKKWPMRKEKIVPQVTLWLPKRVSEFPVCMESTPSERDDETVCSVVVVA